MKKLILATLLAMQAFPMQAQFFSREALGGAAVGGIIGGVVGHNNGRKTAEGAAIGAGAGLLIGAITHQARREREYYSQPAPAPVYSSYHRPNYAVTGAVVGGIAGGVIGHNNGRHTAEGIAIGAGAGLLLGGVAEYSARRRELIYPPAPVAYVQAPTVVTTVPVQTQPATQQITVINHYYPQPGAMSSANTMFGR